MKLEKLQPDVTEIVRAAGATIMTYFKDRDSFSVADKTPDNPVTDADYAADTLLRERLLALLPAAGWLSEETVDSPDRLEKELVWVVDPLDGTKEFVLGIPEISVSVALVQNGLPVMAHIFNPVTAEMYVAVKGQGLWVNGKPATVSGRRELAGAAIDASRSERKRGEFEPFEATMAIRTVGSIAYKLARVAAGQADATWSRGPKNEWDICAGVLLIQEGGGQCVALDDSPFTFNQAWPKVPSIIGDNGHLHGQILAALAPYGAARKD